LHPANTKSALRAFHSGIWAILSGPKLLAFVLFLLLTIPSYAFQDTGLSADAIRFDNLTVDQGLSQTTVNAIYQDQKGFIWLGTSDGLNKYDGYSFTVYKHDPNDPNSLTGNQIRSIYEAPSEPGILWIGTVNSGLVRLDRETGIFTSYEPNANNPYGIQHATITAILEDHTGRFWVGTPNGLHELNRQTGEFSTYVHEMENAESISSNVVTALFEDRFGDLWIGTAQDGLNKYERSTNTFTKYTHFPDDPGTLSNNSITSIIEDGNGILWVGTIKGLNRFNRSDETFTRYTHRPDDPNSLSESMIFSLGTVDVTPDILWIGTANGGLNRFNTRSETFTSYQSDPTTNGSLSHNRVISLMGDHSGVLWIGTALGGVNLTNNSLGTFKHYKNDPENPNSLSDNVIWSILEDSEGYLWVGTDSEGLNKINRTTGQVTRYKYDPNDSNSLSHNSIRGLLEDKDGAIWIGSIGGLDKFDKNTGRFTRYKQPGMPFKLEGHDFVYAMLQDSKGIMWIGMQGGLIKYNPETQAVKQFNHSPDDPLGITGSLILTLYESNNGTIWIGSWEDGLLKYNPETDAFTRYRHDEENPGSISSNTVLSIAEDYNGRMWIGTAAGLNKFDQYNETFVRFTEQNSDLPTNSINGILLADNGNIWLSSHNGLSRLNPETETFHNYGIERGLQSREFNGGAYHKTADGELLFGGINGLNAFYPEDIKDNPIPPKVTLTSLKIWNKPISFSDHTQFNEHISMARSITLDHNENDLTFDYVGLHYEAPKYNSYAYLLEGFDEGWRVVDSRRSAMYTNLPPGAYTFRVRAANSDGVWNNEGTALALTIRPPWWRTYWAYLFYFLTLAAGIAVVDRVQRQRVIGKERERSRIREMQLQAQAAEAQATALRVENERQTRELEEARHLQLSMLPRTTPNHPLVDIATSMETATEVGGDYYDFHENNEGILTIAIGDATGHGANAGTMVTATKALFNALADESDPAEMLTKASLALRGMGFRKLFMAMALLRLRGHTLELAGAGMPPAILYRAATGEIETLPLKGIPLGGPLIGYEKQETTLQIGDTLMLMSDGFPELFRKDGNMLGYKESVEIFRQVAEKSPQEIIDHFEKTGEEWLDGNSPDDDITFVVLKVKR